MPRRSRRLPTPTSRRCASRASTFRTASTPRTGGPKAAAPSMEFGPAAEPLTPIREDLVFVARPLQPDRARLHQPPPGPHEHALRRQGEPRSQRHSRRHHHGPGAGAAHRPSDRGAQPGARHRAQRTAPGRRPLHALRLLHFLGLGHQARHQGNLPRAHLRPVGGRRQGPQARPQHPRRRAAGDPRPAAEDQHRRSQEARRISGIGARHRKAHRPRRQAGAARRLAAHAEAAQHAAARRTRFRRIRRTT